MVNKIEYLLFSVIANGGEEFVKGSAAKWSEAFSCGSEYALKKDIATLHSRFGLMLVAVSAR
jgi:hypothetical protein